MTSFCNSSPRHSRYNRMYAPQTFYCHESQLRSFWLRVFVTVHRAIRKTQLRCFPLLAQLLLLIEWRSLRSVPQSDFRVNTKSVCRTLRVFITVHRAIRKTQLRCFPLLTQLLLLIEWRSLRSVPQSDFRVNTKSVCRTLRVFITVHRAIRKTQLRCFPLLTQLLLLIEWRSLRSVPQSYFRVNTKSACRTLRVNCCIEKCTKKEKSF